MSIALYRKYRPQKFGDICGQRVVTVTLLEAIKQGRIAHAFLFFGPRGTGKTSTARLVAKAIQCEKPQEDGEPCGNCEICTLNAKGELIDLIEIDAASNRGIDEMRDLREKMRFAPSRASSKVYIIDEVHMLTKEAFNALLKSLEEPPPGVYFILATTEIHKVPETIISRCQRYDFKRITERDIVEQLKVIVKKEGYEADLGALELLAKAADGGMRDAISMLEQFSGTPLTVELAQERLGLSSHQSCDELYGALGSADAQKGLAVVESLHNDGYDLQQFTISFLGLLRGKLHEAMSANKKTIVPKLLDWIDLFDEAWVKLKNASIEQLPLEIAVIRATQGTPQGATAPQATAQAVAQGATQAVVQGATAPQAVMQGATQVSQAAPREAAPQEAAVQAKRPEGLMHFDAIKKQLPGVLNAIKNPSIRQSFQTGNLQSQDGKVLKFVFSSKFHFDKVHAANAVVEIEDAFKAVLGPDLRVICELDEGEMLAEVTEIDTLGWDTSTEQI